MVLFCVSYAKINLTCKFELNTAILDFERFGAKKIRFSKTRPGDVKWFCFVLVTLKST